MQTNIFTTDKAEKNVIKYKEKWGKNKHDTINRMLEEYIEREG